MKTTLELLVTNAVQTDHPLQVEMQTADAPITEKGQPVVVLSAEDALRVKFEIIALREFRAIIHNAVIDLHGKLGGDER